MGAICVTSKLALVPRGEATCLAKCRANFEHNADNYIIHTMMTESPPQQQQAAAAVMDPAWLAAQVPIELLPSPSRDPSSSVQHPLLQPDFSTGHSQRMSYLTVGPSTRSTADPPFLVDGDAKITGTVTAQSLRIMSDDRLKKNIRPLNMSSLAKLEKLHIVNFDWKLSGQTAVGVLAQQLQPVLPDAVETDTASGMLSAKADALLMYVAKGLQEAHALLKKLDERQAVGMQLLMHALEYDPDTETKANGSLQLGPASNWDDMEDLSDDADSDISMSEPMPSTAFLQSDDSLAAPTGSLSAPSFSSPHAMIKHILQELGEVNPGMPVVVGKLLKQLGQAATWQTYLDTLHTDMQTADGSQRSPGSVFLHLLKKQAQAANLRLVSLH